MIPRTPQSETRGRGCVLPERWYSFPISAGFLTRRLVEKLGSRIVGEGEPNLERTQTSLGEVLASSSASSPTPQSEFYTPVEWYSSPVSAGDLQRQLVEKLGHRIVGGGEHELRSNQASLGEVLASVTATR